MSTSLRHRLVSSTFLRSQRLLHVSPGTSSRQFPVRTLLMSPNPLPVIHFTIDPSCLSRPSRTFSSWGPPELIWNKPSWVRPFSGPKNITLCRSKLPWAAGIPLKTYPSQWNLLGIAENLSWQTPRSEISCWSETPSRLTLHKWLLLECHRTPTVSRPSWGLETGDPSPIQSHISHLTPFLVSRPC
jgi:hypothetical protein